VESGCVAVGLGLDGLMGISLFAVARVNHGSRSQGMMIPRYK
jgi:hypothetical protein